MKKVIRESSSYEIIGYIYMILGTINYVGPNFGGQSTSVVLLILGVFLILMGMVRRKRAVKNQEEIQEAKEPQLSSGTKRRMKK